jgi:hypothetical protein
MKLNNILESIGNTPHLRINHLFGDKHNVWIKLEKQNPGGSIKDRIALSMIEDAESKGLLKKGSVIIEPTSGNTGIGLAMVAAVKGYKIILVMPESMSLERRRLMKAYGATFELTPREKGMKGAIEKAKELAATVPGSWIPQQFDNTANVDSTRAHNCSGNNCRLSERNRLSDYRRWNRRAHNRRSTCFKSTISRRKSIRSGTCSVSCNWRRQAGPAPNTGYWRRLYSR